MYITPWEVYNCALRDVRKKDETEQPLCNKTPVHTNFYLQP